MIVAFFARKQGGRKGSQSETRGRKEEEGHW